MKAKTLFLAIIPLVALLSCGTSQKTPTGKEAYTPEMQKIINEYPDITGFEKRAIFLSKLNPEEQINTMIEIIPGRELYVDCNHYGLQGEMSKRTLERNGYPFFFFNSRGEVFSTQMACPDDTKQMKFVTGETIMTEYRSDLPLVVYTSQFFDVKYSLWKGGEVKSIRYNGNGTLATEEALNSVIDFPQKDGYDRHVLFLPPLDRDDEINRKVEIIPGKTLKVDCNKHSMTGTIQIEQVTGFGYEYQVFESDGNYISTRMGCPDNSLQDKFISGETKMLPYNSRLPIVIYTPKGFGVNYKIWETNGKMY